MTKWFREHVLPRPDWWFNMDYGTGPKYSFAWWEGRIRQHVPAHVGQGFILYWFFKLFWWAVLEAVVAIVEYAAALPVDLPSVWVLIPFWLTALAAMSTQSINVWWELLQRERWRHDVGGGNRMPMKENVWDAVLGAGGIGLAIATEAGAIAVFVAVFR